MEITLHIFEIYLAKIFIQIELREKRPLKPY